MTTKCLQEDSLKDEEKTIQNDNENYHIEIIEPKINNNKGKNHRLSLIPRDKLIPNKTMKPKKIMKTLYNSTIADLEDCPKNEKTDRIAFSNALETLKVCRSRPSKSRKKYEQNTKENEHFDSQTNAYTNCSLYNNFSGTYNTNSQNNKMNNTHTNTHRHNLSLNQKKISEYKDSKYKKKMNYLKIFNDSSNSRNHSLIKNNQNTNNNIKMYDINTLNTNNLNNHQIIYNIKSYSNPYINLNSKNLEHKETVEENKIDEFLEYQNKEDSKVFKVACDILLFNDNYTNRNNSSKKLKSMTKNYDINNNNININNININRYSNYSNRNINDTKIENKKLNFSLREHLKKKLENIPKGNDKKERLTFYKPQIEITKNINTKLIRNSSKNSLRDILYDKNKENIQQNNQNIDSKPYTEGNIFRENKGKNMKEDKEPTKENDANIKDKNEFSKENIPTNRKSEPSSSSSNDLVTMKRNYSFNNSSKLSSNKHNKNSMKPRQILIQYADEYQENIFPYLFNQENLVKINPNYCENQTEISSSMVSILVDWLIDVHLKFHLLNETLYLTMSFIHRYLSKKPVKKRQLQLLGITALLIASKYEEIYPPDIKYFVYVTDDAYTKEDVLKMEENILSTLDYDLTYPTSLRYAEILFVKMNFFNSSGSDHNKIKFSKVQYLLEIMLVFNNFLEFTYLEQALAAFYLTLENVKEKKEFSNIINDIYSEIKVNNLSKNEKFHRVKRCIFELRHIAKSIYNKKFKLMAVYKKYNSSKLCNVASMRYW